MSETPITCPRCHSNPIVKNGFIHNGNQNFKCKDCGRQFGQNPTKKVIGQETSTSVGLPTLLGKPIKYHSM